MSELRTFWRLLFKLACRRSYNVVADIVVDLRDQCFCLVCAMLAGGIRSLNLALRIVNRLTGLDRR